METDSRRKRQLYVGMGNPLGKRRNLKIQRSNNFLLQNIARIYVSSSLPSGIPVLFFPLPLSAGMIPEISCVCGIGAPWLKHVTRIPISVDSLSRARAPALLNDYRCLDYRRRCPIPLTRRRLLSPIWTLISTTP